MMIFQFTNCKRLPEDVRHVPWLGWLVFTSSFPAYIYTHLLIYLYIYIASGQSQGDESYRLGHPHPSLWQQHQSWLELTVSAAAPAIAVKNWCDVRLCTQCLWRIPSRSPNLFKCRLRWFNPFLETKSHGFLVRFSRTSWGTKPFPPGIWSSCSSC